MYNIYVSCQNVKYNSILTVSDVFLSHMCDVLKGTSCLLQKTFFSSSALEFTWKRSLKVFEKSLNFIFYLIKDEKPIFIFYMLKNLATLNQCNYNINPVLVSKLTNSSNYVSSLAGNASVQSTSTKSRPKSGSRWQHACSSGS